MKRHQNKLHSDSKLDIFSKPANKNLKTIYGLNKPEKTCF